jgi:hypothetical protein
VNEFYEEVLEEMLALLESFYRREMLAASTMYPFPDGLFVAVLRGNVMTSGGSIAEAYEDECAKIAYAKALALPMEDMQVHTFNQRLWQKKISILRSMDDEGEWVTIVAIGLDGVLAQPLAEALACVLGMCQTSDISKEGRELVRMFYSSGLVCD